VINEDSGAGYRYQAYVFSGVTIPSEAGPISPQGALKHILCQAGSRVSISVNRANSNARERMPPHSLKSASPLRGILCSIPENTSQECATESYFKDCLGGSFVPGMCGVTPLRINLPASKSVVRIERTIGSESAAVRRVCGLCPADPHTQLGPLPFRP
jgi:hypothetical protein